MYCMAGFLRGGPSSSQHPVSSFRAPSSADGGIHAAFSSRWSARTTAKKAAPFLPLRRGGSGRPPEARLVRRGRLPLPPFYAAPSHKVECRSRTLRVLVIYCMALRGMAFLSIAGGRPSRAISSLMAFPLRITCTILRYISDFSREVE